MTNIPRAAGPDCPACGCNESEVLRVTMRWGIATARRRCGACGLEYGAPVQPPKAKDKPGDSHE